MRDLLAGSTVSGSGAEDIGAQVSAEQVAIEAERSALAARLRVDSLIYSALVHFIVSKDPIERLAYVNAGVDPSAHITDDAELFAAYKAAKESLSPLVVIR